MTAVISPGWGESKTGGRRFNLRELRFKNDMRDNVFTLRLVCAWNKLQGKVVEAGTIITVKRHLDRYLDMNDLEERARHRQVGFTELVNWVVMDKLGRKAYFGAE